MLATALFITQAFTIEGRIVSGANAVVTLHSSATPFTATDSVKPGGKFKFRKLEPGTYTIVVFVEGRGELRNSVVVGPGTADTRDTVRITIDTESGTLSRERAHLVDARGMAVPANARREYASALRCLRTRDVDGAVQHLRRATTIAPEFAAAWNHLGTIAYQRKQFADAEGFFRTASRADPRLYEAIVNLGGVLVTTGQLDEALRVNTRAVAEKPDDPLAQSQLGMTYLFRGQLDPAEQHLSRAVELDPRHFSRPQLHLAEIYRRRGDTRKAAEQLESFLRYHPDDPETPRLRDLLSRWR